MCITLDDVRTYQRLKTSDASKDGLINSLIPSVVAEIGDMCGTKSRTVTLTSTKISFASNVILIVDTSFTEKKFSTNMLIKVENSLANDGYYLIQVANSNSLEIKMPGDTLFAEEATGEEITISLVIIPFALKSAALEMITYKMNLLIAQGITSESIGRYSASYSTDYPVNIKTSLARFKKVKW